MQRNALTGIILHIGNKYHPLSRLRKTRWFQKLTVLLNIPLPIRFPDIDRPVYVSLSRNLSFVLSAGEAAEEAERGYFIRITKLGGFQTFYDIGANVGLYGFMFKNLVPRGKVLLFEPDVSNAKLIRRTLDKYPRDDTQLVEAAVSDREGTADFYEDALSGAAGTLQLDVRGGFVSTHYHVVPSKITVKTVTLDQMVLQHGAPDFIKIDVEGAELSVFEGASNLIETSHPAIMFECDSRDLKIMDILARAGYVLFDFSTLKKTDVLLHNILALHGEKHKDIISAIT